MPIRPLTIARLLVAFLCACGAEPQTGPFVGAGGGTVGWTAGIGNGVDARLGDKGGPGLDVGATGHDAESAELGVGDPDAQPVDTEPGDAQTDADTPADAIADAAVGADGVDASVVADVADAGTETAVDGGSEAGVEDGTAGGDGAWWNTPIPGEDASTVTIPDAGDTSKPTDAAAPPAGLCQSAYSLTPIELTVGGSGKVDIVVWIDTSGSMAQEAQWTKANINNFANFISAKGIDFHLVLIGSGSGAFDVCIAPPLGDNGCYQPNTKGTFLPIKQVVSSTNGLSLILSTFPQWAAFLRPDAAKNFLGITDDNSSLPAASFKQQLATKTLPNGGLAFPPTATQPLGFTYHSIHAWTSAADCPTIALWGKVYDQLVQETGGVKHKVCLNDWSPIFEDIAKGVIATAKAECTYAITTPPGKVLKPEMLKVAHTDDSQPPEKIYTPLANIPDGTFCAGQKNGWYFSDWQKNDATGLPEKSKPTKVTICKEQCSQFKGGLIAFNFGCI